MNNVLIRFTRCLKRVVQAAVGLASVFFLLTDGHAQAFEGISSNALQQIHALQLEKETRTPTQLKIDSRLIYALKKSLNQAMASGVTNLRTSVQVDSAGRAKVDLDATVTADLLAFISSGGGSVVSSFPQFQTVRASVPLAMLEALAGRSDVKNIKAVVPAIVNTGSVTSEGDVTHRADQARQTFGVDGTGVKVGVLSDSVDFLANSQSTGDLPSDLIVLPGQSGIPASGEGTAMLEIVHDLAPGSKLYYATAFNGQASFAQNIINLRAAGCDIIIDDVGYANESPFQDGIIAQAVNTVTADGALYFSSAANSGSFTHGTSGTWQGDFVDAGPTGTPITRAGILHSFGASAYDTLTRGGFWATLFWADPLGASTNDYDLYLLDSTGANIVDFSTTVQNGSQDPFEFIGAPANGERLVIVKAAGDPRFLHLDTGRGQLTINTSGNTKGHSAATDAFSVAAVNVATSYPNPFSGGAANPTENFSSDGPRRVFFQANGTPITPGNFSSTGGFVRQKPDIAAADGVVTTLPPNSGLNPFFGTSAAAPHAGAIAALLKSYNPNLTTAQVRALLTGTALDIEAPGVDDNAGFGLVMAAQVLQASPPPLPLPRFILSTNYIVGGNGNGAVDYNECNDLYLVITNLGFADATGVEVTLSTTTPGVSFGMRRSAYPNMPVGEGGTNLIAFAMSTAPFFVCGSDIDISVQIKSDQVVATNGLVLKSGSIGTPDRFDSTGAVFIRDNDTIGTNSLISVSNILSAINKVTVSLYITHTFDSDIFFELIGPDGTTVMLSDHNGGGGNNFGASCSPDSFRTTFDDDAVTPIGAGLPPFVGVFKPQQPLSAFIGKSGTNVNGIWKIHVVDDVGIDVGFLECWSLNISSATCVDGGGTCPGADLAIGMIDSPDPVFIGSNLVYTISITNNGPSPAKNVVINHVLPPSVVFASAFSSQGSVSQSGGSVIANIGTIPITGTAYVTVNVIPTLVGVINSSASATANDPDPDTSNNSVSVSTHVNLPASDIAVGLFDSPDPSLLGGTLTYTVSVTNNGPSTATGVFVTNTLPLSVTVQGVTPSQGSTINGNVVVCNFGVLATAGRATATIAVTPQAEGVITATAVARASQAEPLPSNNTASATTTIGPSADMAITITAAPEPVVVRSNWTYTITVTNNGPSTASGVVVNQTLAVGVNIVGVPTTSFGSISAGAGTVTANIGTLARNAGAVITVTANATNVGNYAASATATAAQNDSNSANNTAAVLTTVDVAKFNVAAAGTTITNESVLPADGALSPNETITALFRLKNSGNINGGNVTATLLATGGVTSPSPVTPVAYGTLLAGGAAVGQPFTFTATGTIGGTVVATLQVFTNGVFFTNVTFSFTLPTVKTFSNTNYISITDNVPSPWPAGPASPYPSTIVVSNLTGLVGKVIVTLSNLSHTYPDDMDVLLVGPSGQKVILMSDAGGPNAIVNQNVTFDDAASSASDEGQIVATSYHPADYETGDVFNAPAPAGSYATNLSSFAGANANGTWALYIMDDMTGDKGSIASGWSLAFTTLTPVNQLADLALIAAATPDPVLVGGALTCTYTVTNGGPNTATSVLITNVVPSGATILDASAPLGSWSTNGNTATALFGSINAGSIATLTVVIKPGTGSLTNPTIGVIVSTANVIASETDLNPANNSATAVALVNLPVADLVVSQTTPTNVITLNSNVTFTLSVTNLGPQTALGVVLTDVLPSGLDFVSTSATTFTNSSGSVAISFGDLVSGGTASCTLTAHASSAGSLTNVTTATTASGDTNSSNNSVSFDLNVVAPAPSIVAAGSLITGETNVNGSVDLGERVTVSLTLQNVGTANAVNLRATLQSSGGVSAPTGPQSYGALALGGGSAAGSFTFTAASTPGGVVVATLSLKDEAPTVTNDLGTVNFYFNLPGTVSFTNSTAITIPDHGAASPYPSTIVVSGVTGVINGVTVSLNGLTHAFPEDLDVLLVGPTGQKLMLMSDAGGGHAVTNRTLVFADGNASLPDADTIFSGTYQPTDYEPGVDVFPSPAPAGTPLTSLAGFAGVSPNGNWSLYIVDDAFGDAGVFSGGWSVTISTISPINPLADVAISMTAGTDPGAPNPPYVGSALIYAIGVTNNGPATATGVTVTDNLPAGLVYVSSTASPGSLVNNGGSITWTVGSLSAGASAGVSVRVAAFAGGSVVNNSIVAASETDLNNLNNVAQTTTNVRIPLRANLTGTTVTTNVQVTLIGDAGLSYRILASTNLTTWTILSTNTAAANGTVKITDSAATGFSRRFYRAERLIP